MVRILTERAYDGLKKYIEAAGLSTDTKPTAGIITGSKFTEVDTGAEYYFDETAGTWAEGGGDVAVDGATPEIAGKDGLRYVCGEVSEIEITLPESGMVDVVFTSGTTPTVLSITGNPDITWPGWFDPTSLDASTVYELNIAGNLTNGYLGAVGTWA